jgi:hypothetical protein
MDRKLKSIFNISPELNIRLLFNRANVISASFVDQVLGNNPDFLTFDSILAEPELLFNVRLSQSSLGDMGLCQQKSAI